MVREIAVGDDKQGLAVERFLEVAGFATHLFDNVLRRRFGAGANNLHHVVSRWLAGVPATARCSLGQVDRLLGRLHDRLWSRGPELAWQPGLARAWLLQRLAPGPDAVRLQAQGQVSRPLVAR